MSGIRPRLEDAGVELDHVVLEIHREFSDFAIVPKSASRLMRVIDVLLRVITFGQMTRFMSYTTTLGNTVYTAKDWEKRHPLERATTLRHERVHMRQRIRMGRFYYEFSYLFLPLPLVFARGRRDLEMEGYVETLRALAQYFGIRAIDNDKLREQIVSQFLGASYFWAWPFRKDVERWYDAAVAEISRSVH